MAMPDADRTGLLSPAEVVPDDIAPLVIASDEGRADARSSRSRRKVMEGTIAAVLGVALIIVGLIVMSDVAAGPRVLLVLAGVYALFVSLDRFGTHIAGPQFDAGFWLSAIWIGLVALLAVFADLLPLRAYDNVQQALLEPSLARPDLFSAHPLGTDNQGFDILGGVIHGARTSLVVGSGAVLIGMLVGSMIGVAAGYYRGRIDGGASLLADAMLAFPPLILLLALVTVLEPSMLNITLALALLGIPTYIRLSRVNAMVFTQREFVSAARVLGAKNRRIIFREVLPNVALPVVSFAFIVIGALIVAEASLGFLGLGIQRPTPTWGNMIAGGQSDFFQQPHVVFVPGVVLFLTVFSFNRIGERARAKWDPRRSRL